MTEDKKDFGELFLSNGELKKDKLRGAMVKWTKDRGLDLESRKDAIRYRDDKGPLVYAFSEFESWLSRKTTYRDYTTDENSLRENVRSVFENLYETHGAFSEYIDDKLVKVDMGGTVIEGEEEPSNQDDEDSGKMWYGELHEAGLVDKKNNIDEGKLMGSMSVFAKQVEAIEAPNEEPNIRDFVSAWNRFMLDKFSADWIKFTQEKIDPDDMKQLADDFFIRSDDINDIMEEKWEYSPDEREGNSESGKPDSIGGWDEYNQDKSDQNVKHSSDNNDSTDVPDNDGETQHNDGGTVVTGGSSYDIPASDPINTVINADSVHAISEIAEANGKIVDAVITDVPYGQDFDPRKKEDEGIHGDSSVRKAMDINRAVFKKMRMLVKKGSPVMTFAGDSCLFEMKEVVENWYDFKQIVVWNKQHIGMSSLSDNAIRWRPKHEYIILGSNGDPRAENSNRHDGSVLEFTRPSNDDRFHPTEKPEDLMRYLVESLTEEGDVVLDPFAGSGVTLDAARQTGRKYIGIEIDEEFHEKIQERLSQMTLV
jgi:DNA modification methylase